MNTIKLILPVSFALALAACGHAPSNQPAPRAAAPMAPAVQGSGHHHMPAAPAMAADARFSCQNGLSVNIRHLGNDKVELALDDKRATLTSAVSGSGERYVGNSGLFGRGAEWHQKGKQGFLTFVDPYGNKVETPCQAVAK
ncbi:MAG: MliC family protein [Comamonadaceae bacterium]|nr:MliC family protein [Comamonadaceae bacterium]RRD57423.1 hypothetical protein EII20_07370 [Comamonadaceae bacterium OH2545_COT-014]